MAELQKYQWTTSGMRPDDSELGAMWFYRGFDTDLELMRLHDERGEWAEAADGEMSRLQTELESKDGAMTADELRTELVERCRAIDADLRKRELIVRVAQEEHNPVIEVLRRQYDALAFLMPMIDDAMAGSPITFEEEDDD